MSSRCVLGQITISRQHMRAKATMYNYNGHSHYNTELVVRTYMPMCTRFVSNFIFSDFILENEVKKMLSER